MTFNWEDYYREEPTVTTVEKEPPPEKKEKEKKTESFDWEDYYREEPSEIPVESDLKTASRYALQIPAAAAKILTWPLDYLRHIVATGYEAKAEVAEPGPEREKAEEALQQVYETFPTQDLAENWLEEQGIPIQAQNAIQKGTRITTMAALGRPGGIATRAKAGTKAAGTYAGLRSIGTPEPTAEAASLLTGLIGAKPGTQAEVAEELGGRVPPESPTLIAEQLSKELEPGKPSPPPGGGPQPPPAGPSKPLTGRTITQRNEELGIKPAPLKVNAPLEEKVGNIISENKFYNTTQGGQALMKEIRKADKADYKKVNDAYTTARDLNKNVHSIHPDLVNELESMATDLEKIPSKSSPEMSKLKSINEILDALAGYETVKDEAGNVTKGSRSGYKEISNQILFDQLKSLRHKIDYDFAHGDANNIFKPIINAIEDSIIFTSENAGNKAAIDAAMNAKSLYKDWTNTYNTDYVRPFRDTTNKDYSKLFKSAQDIDEINVLKTILDKSQDGKVLSSALERHLVEKNLDKYLANPNKVNPKEFNSTLRELEAVVPKEKIDEIRSSFNQAKKGVSFKATQQEKAVAQDLGLTPREILSKTKDRLGIRELKSKLRTDIQKKHFDALMKQKARDILTEGNIEKKYTGDDLYRILNKSNNYDIFSEILGEDVIKEALQESKKYGKQQIRKEKLKTAGGKIGLIKFVDYVAPIILELI